ncbi:hypothetical protein P3T76_007644 [Phytophthora citrophthora]|uniref:Retrovirus-related Pol polyprotein from transposon TNT 1-94-like beta-barrel domain-containing protein n=1 Tax=Phytophthora citrophthora TaxID=4793 RepID=A0AAD9GMP0_9STRA|nr:hypothetical protein P3T76_007644 [Phytophthora citrophthora]
MEEGLRGEAEGQHQKRVALERLAEQHEAEHANLQAQLQRDREDLARGHEVQLKEIGEREQLLSMEKERVTREANRQKELGAALVSQVRRVNVAQEQLDAHLRKAVEEAYRRGKMDAERIATMIIDSGQATKPQTVHKVELRSTGRGVPGPQPLAASTLSETKVPLAKNCKLNLRYFNGSELCKGLGAGFKPWAINFKQQIDLAEQACGHKWPEEVKVSVLGSYLRGSAENYFDGMKDQWWDYKPAVQHALDEMELAFNRTITTTQINKLMVRPKSSTSTWHEHLLYLMAVTNATHAPVAQVPEHLVFHADEEMARTLSTLYNKDVKNHIAHANELAEFAQMFEDNLKKVGKSGKMAATAHTDNQTQEDIRTNTASGKATHGARTGSEKKEKGNDDPSNPRWGFSGLVAGDVTSEDWIIDLGASTHLVRDAAMLQGWRDEDEPEGVMLPDGSKLRTTRRGTLKLRVFVDGEYFWVPFKNASYAPGLAVNLISLGVLFENGCTLDTRQQKYAIVKNGEVVMHVQLKKRFAGTRSRRSRPKDTEAL